jgi:hypothetical protein
VVVLQPATESFSAFDAASDGISIIHWLNQLIAQSLMVPFCVVMLDVFANGVLQ